MNRHTWLSAFIAVAVVSGCSHRPPADFHPDPGLLSHIRGLEIRTTQTQACPGGAIQASYEAVLDDGTHVPFVRSYDKKHPPRLHVDFLERTSPEASSNRGGDWVTYANPLPTVGTGFRLTAILREKPSVQRTVVIAPDYSCMAHAFTFSGDNGKESQAGGNGPDVTVRLGMARSPFYEKLLITSIQVGTAIPFYALYDARAIPPADWLAIESRGGRGGAGIPGAKGRDGVVGASGCPAQAGGPGGDGGDGAPGARGGRGGRITVIVPDDQPFLAGLVDARSIGGAGGPGGEGGKPGLGGKGGQGLGSESRRCADGQDGLAGRKGRSGPDGSGGWRGQGREIVTVPARDVFGSELPSDLAQLFEPPSRRRP